MQACGGGQSSVGGETAEDCRPHQSQTRLLPSPRLRRRIEGGALISSCGGDVCSAALATVDHPAAPSQAAEDRPENGATNAHAYDPARFSAYDSDPSPYPYFYSPFYFPHAHPTNADSPHSEQNAQRSPQPPSPCPSCYASGSAQASCSPSSQSSAGHPHAYKADCGSKPAPVLGNPHSLHHP